MKKYYLIIDGEKISTEKTFDVINPATGAIFAQAPDCSPAQLDIAVDAANRAFQSWKIDESARRNALSKCSDILRTSANGRVIL
jgi:acyl-CoA reductase-like NAD-dependent aldehyde dehydrogenase